MQNAIGNYPISNAYPNISIEVIPPKGAQANAVMPQVQVNGQPYATSPVTYPANYYMNNLAQPQVTLTQDMLTALQKIAENTKKDEKPKTEVTESYTKALCDYLVSDKEEHRLLAAKEVVARLEEDKTRKNNPQLTACINKMLQDESAKVRMLSLAALNSNIVEGDASTVQILNNISQQNTGYGQDAINAKSILLKLASSK